MDGIVYGDYPAASRFYYGSSLDRRDQSLDRFEKGEGEELVRSFVRSYAVVGLPFVRNYKFRKSGKRATQIFLYFIYFQRETPTTRLSKTSRWKERFVDICFSAVNSNGRIVDLFFFF